MDSHPPFSATRLPELDGIRGLAILGVVIAHYFGEVPNGIKAFTFGEHGVDLFFILSGFLVGGILLDQRGASNYFSTFYIRRTCRIFPIYYLSTALFLLFIHSFRPSYPEWIGEPFPIWAYATYTQNFLMTYLGVRDHSVLEPTWSLAVEEQFYLLLPLVIYLIPRKLLPAMLWVLILSAMILRVAMLGAPGGHWIGSFVLLPCRWDMLFMGVAAAMIRRNPALWAKATDKDGRILKILVLACGWALVLAMLVGPYVSPNVSVLHTVGLPFFGVCFSSYLLLSISKEEEGRTMRNPVLRFFGGISYGLYLFHQPIALILHTLLLGSQPGIGPPMKWLVTLLSLGVSVGVAWLSFTFFETPLVKFGHRWKYGASPAPAVVAAPSAEAVGTTSGK